MPKHLNRSTLQMYGSATAGISFPEDRGGETRSKSQPQTPLCCTQTASEAVAGAELSAVTSKLRGAPAAVQVTLGTDNICMQCCISILEIAWLRKT